MVQGAAHEEHGKLCPCAAFLPWSAAGWRRRAARQQGSGDSAAVVVAVAMRLRRPLWQLGDNTASLVAALRWEARRQRQRGGGGGGQRVGSATASGMAAVAAATAVLPPRAAAVAMKSPAVTVMAGAQTTINNQLKSATAMADGRVVRRISIF